MLRSYFFLILVLQHCIILSVFPVSKALERNNTVRLKRARRIAASSVHVGAAVSNPFRCPRWLSPLIYSSKRKVQVCRPLSQNTSQRRLILARSHARASLSSKKCSRATQHGGKKKSCVARDLQLAQANCLTSFAHAHCGVRAFCTQTPATGMHKPR